MNQPTITCPHCEAEITLTESLADPLIRATRKKIAEKEAEVARRESAIGANAPNSPRRLNQSSSSSLPDSRPSERGLRQRRPRRHDAGGRPTLNVSHRRLLTYSASSKNATTN